ncbi:MAG: hypothetical protein ACQEVA_23145, partial [Myxococcota bacterium]
MSEKNSIDNSNIAGSVVGSGSQQVGGDLNATVQPASPAAELDHASFKADVDEALKALTDEIDSLEEHYDALHAALVRIRKQSADAETVGDVQKMVEEIWLEKTSEEFQTNLEKYGSKDFAKALLSSPVIAGLVG